MPKTSVEEMSPVLSSHSSSPHNPNQPNYPSRPSSLPVRSFGPNRQPISHLQASRHLRHAAFQTEKYIISLHITHPKRRISARSAHRPHATLAGQLRPPALRCTPLLHLQISLQRLVLGIRPLQLCFKLADPLGSAAHLAFELTVVELGIRLFTLELCAPARVLLLFAVFTEALGNLSAQLWYCDLYLAPRLLGLPQGGLQAADMLPRTLKLAAEVRVLRSLQLAQLGRLRQQPAVLLFKPLHKSFKLIDF